MTTLSLSSTIQNYPDWPYETIKNSILGKSYQLSLTFVGKDRAQKLNITTRNKDYIPNVLSFPLDDSAGEMYICPAAARPQAADFNLSVDDYIAYLFIHGCVHLKGYDHGDTMDKMEQKYLRQFRIS
jgi:probable rRNA maturation factor